MRFLTIAIGAALAIAVAAQVGSGWRAGMLSSHRAPTQVVTGQQPPSPQTPAISAPGPEGPAPNPAGTPSDVAVNVSAPGTAVSVRGGAVNVKAPDATVSTAGSDRSVTINTPHVHIEVHGGSGATVSVNARD